MMDGYSLKTRNTHNLIQKPFLVILGKFSSKVIYIHEPKMIIKFQIIHESIWTN